MYMKSEMFWAIAQLILLLLIFIPTMVGFLTGAPWVPTPMTAVRKMVELAKLKPGDRVYDLGCGDGRLVQEAAIKCKADAVGIELSPLLFFFAKLRNFIKRSSAVILLRDYRRIHFGNAKALFFYLLPDTLERLKPKFEDELTPGTLLISYAFQIRGWTPIYTEPNNPAEKRFRIFVYQVPSSIKAPENSAKKETIATKS